MRYVGSRYFGAVFIMIHSALMIACSKALLQYLQLGSVHYTLACNLLTRLDYCGTLERLANGRAVFTPLKVCYAGKVNRNAEI